MHPNLLKSLLISWLFVGAAFIPWGAYVLYSGEASQQEPSLTTPTTLNVFSTFTEFLFGFQDDHVNTVMLSLWPLTVVFAFLALRQMRKPQIETEYFMLSVFAPILIAFFVSILLRPVFVSRYLIFTIPALFLLLSSIISLYPRPIRYTARILVVGLMCLALGSEIFNPSVPVKENYRDASLFLEQNAKAQDIVVLSAPFTLYPIEYYYQGQAPISTLPVWNQYAHGAIPSFSPATLPQEATALISNHQNVWLLLSYDQGYAKDIQKYFDTHYARIVSKEFSPGLTLIGYQVRYDTPLAQSTRKQTSASY